MKLFEYMTVFNKQMIYRLSTDKTNDERTCCDKYRLSCKNLRFIDINIKRGERNTGVILYVDILFTVKLVKILVCECISYDICIQDFHLVNECRLVFCKYVICRKCLY